MLGHSDLAKGSTPASVDESFGKALAPGNAYDPMRRPLEKANDSGPGGKFVAAADLRKAKTGIADVKKAVDDSGLEDLKALFARFAAAFAAFEAAQAAGHRAPGDPPTAGMRSVSVGSPSAQGGRIFADGK
jgi:hypothetical protein